MKKYFVLVVVVILIAGFAWYVYDKNYRYGSPIRETVVTSGYFFEGAKSEKEMIYERMGNRYHVLISESKDEETSKGAFFIKKKHYLQNYPNNKESENDGVYKFIGNNGSGPYFVAFHYGITNVEVELLEGGGEEAFADWFVERI